MTPTTSDPTPEEVDRRRIERFAEWTIDAFLSLENADVIFDRIEKMLPPGQRFTYMRMWMDGSADPDVQSGVTRDAQAVDRGLRRHNKDGHAGLSVYGTGVVQFGLSTVWGTERAVRHAIQASGGTARGIGTRHPDGFTHVHLTGGLHEDGPGGSSEHLTITHTNENGVSWRYVIVPEFVDVHERVEREATMLESAARYLQNFENEYDASNRLEELAGLGRYDWKPLASRTEPMSDKDRDNARKYTA